MTYSVRVKIDNVGELEVSGDASHVVVDLVNKATKKFFGDTTFAETNM